MQISIKADVDQAVKYLGRLQRQVPFAASVAMNKTAVEIQKVEQDAMRRELDEPRPSTVKGVRVKRSNKRNLVAAVFVIPAIDAFLRYQVHGGVRPPRSVTEAVPFNIPLNRYGNIPGRRTGKLQKLLNRQDTFTARINGVAGIWQRGKGRNSRGVTLLVAFENRTRYRPRFRFYEHAVRTTRLRWHRNFRRALRQAIRTARI